MTGQNSAHIAGLSSPWPLMRVEIIAELRFEGVENVKRRKFELYVLLNVALPKGRGINCASSLSEFGVRESSTTLL